MKHPPSLSSRRDFDRVLSRGAKQRTPVATIYAAPGPAPEAPARLGLAVSARAGGAVTRNRIKRRLRAAFRAAGPDRGLDVVIRARAEAATAPFQELEDSLSDLRELR